MKKAVFLLFVGFLGCNYNSNSFVDNDFPEIPDFKFLDQDSVWVTKSTFKNSIFIADFFFTRCKSICPLMKSNMTRLYLEFEGNERVKFLSHTIDPEHDNVSVLNTYANSLGVKSSQWHFVTGKQEEIYDLAHRIYKNSVLEDKGSEEGFIHSGAFILVNNEGRIVKHYDGLKLEEIEQLKMDIKKMISNLN